MQSIKQSLKKSFTTKSLTTSAVCIAIASVLSLLTIYKAPYGGSVTAFSMLFIVIIGYMHGLYAGLVAGFVYSIIQFILGPYFLTPVQFMLDYVLAFTSLGISGIFVLKKFGLIYGMILACIMRFIFVSIAGAVFFAEYAPEGMNPILYTVLYNGTYIGIELMLTIIILLIVPFEKIVKTTLKL